MIFSGTPIDGVHVIAMEPRTDERGYFARAFCEREFGARGLVTHPVQMNASLNLRRGTLRGMHYQLAPRAETKIVRCTRGRLHDVALDLRKGSPTFGRHFGVELSAANGKALYLPKGCAHGFVTLEDDTEAFYLVDEFYSPEHERGVRWDDPAFAIAWPVAPAVISEKDRTYRDFDPAWHLGA